MAATLSHCLSKFDIPKHPFLNSHKLSRNRSFSLSISTSTLLRSSKHKNSPTTSLKISQQEENNQSKKSQSPLPPKPVDVAVSNPTFSLLFRRIRDGFKIDELTLEILSIALPAALALAADPIASLVDTAFVGHLGSVELAAVGISVSIFNLVSKLFNVPLLNVTTSFVAEEQALISKNSDDGAFEQKGKQVLPSVSTSLALAAGLGIAEAVALSLGSGSLMNIMVAGNILNAILDTILIFPIGLGVAGAAVATVISEYLIALILLWELNGKVELISPNVDWRKVAIYLKSGGLLIGRTIATLGTLTLATSLAAKQGPVPMAGHQICIEVWLAISLLTDALALSGQALLAADYSQANYQQARRVIYSVLQIGLVTGFALAVLLFLGFGAFSSLFSTDPLVLQIAWSGTLFVAGSQPVNAIAFVIDGLYYGVSDYEYAAISMVL
ncbi:Multi antimicrobial extrusion protein [Corchorus olitorius]|uniref:Multi antimicrobial extrusion protein n=1 Tax=Corchorus olitorius TaxID=93759 RepID=A0A1R3JRY1_9ROSI|nr:Multi antimicrobial extrusion protein [Corchorus olitorius]